MVVGLKWIQLELLPANKMELLYLVDWEVITALKVRFHKRLLQRMVVCVSQDKEYKMDIVGAIHFIANAWTQPKAATMEIASGTQDLPE